MDLKLHSLKHFNAKGTCEITYNMTISHFANHIISLLGFKKEPDAIIPSYSMRLSREENEATALIIEGPKSDFDINAIDEFKNKYNSIVLLENDRLYLNVSLATIFNDIIKNIKDGFTQMYPKLIIDNTCVIPKYNDDESIRSFSIWLEFSPKEK